MKTFAIMLLLVFFEVLARHTTAQTEVYRPLIADPDRFYTSEWRDERHRIDNLATQLNNSSKRAVIVMTFATRTPISDRVKRIGRIRDRFIKLHVQPERVLLVISEAPEEQTVFWLLDDESSWQTHASPDQHVIRLSDFKRLKKRSSIARLMDTNTIKLHRVFNCSPEKLYNAFLDPAAMCKWLPPNGFTGEVHHMDARVGGTYKMSFTNFGKGVAHSFGGEYLELAPGERIVHTDKFDDPNMQSDMKTTVTFRAVSVGTELNVTQEGVPGVIPPEMCYLGWQDSLRLLALLVETDIPG